jgi:hypothetical protein
MRFDFEVCVLRFLGFCNVMMKTLALKKKKNQKIIISEFFIE